MVSIPWGDPSILGIRPAQDEGWNRRHFKKCSPGQPFFANGKALAAGALVSGKALAAGALVSGKALAAGPERQAEVTSG